MALKLYLIQKKLLISSVSFFVSIESSFKIDKDKRYLVETNDASDLVLYNAYPCILSIKETVNNNEFFFWNAPYEEILNEINSQHSQKIFPCR